MLYICISGVGVCLCVSFAITFEHTHALRSQMLQPNEFGQKWPIPLCGSGTIVICIWVGLCVCVCVYYIPRRMQKTTGRTKGFITTEKRQAPRYYNRLTFVEFVFYTDYTKAHTQANVYTEPDATTGPNSRASGAGFDVMWWLWSRVQPNSKCTAVYIYNSLPLCLRMCVCVYIKQIVSHLFS